MTCSLGCVESFIYFKGRNFRGKKLSRFRKTAKFLHFAGINFRGWRLMKIFAGINFRGEPLSKDFPGNKKGENLNLWEETFVFIVLWLRSDLCDHLTCVKIAKKEFQKTCFPLFFLSWVLNFWNFTNATIIWYHNYKSVFFSEYSQMTNFLENFAGRNFRGWRLLKNFAGINFRGFG